MQKKHRWIQAIGATVLTGAIIFSPNAADASASMGASNNHEDVQQQDRHHEDFWRKFFQRWDFSWQSTNKHEWNHSEKPKNTQPMNPAPQEDKQETTNEKVENSSLSAYEQKVVELTNQERAKYGLSALKVDNELSRVAKDKSKDMLNKNYFAHQSPTYGSPFDMMRAYGVDYLAAGENIAKGQQTPEEVVNAWMNSEGHRANILNGTFTHIGVGFVEQGNIWTQQFIEK